MARAFNSIVIFFLIHEVMQTVCGENDLFNTFGPQLNKKGDLEDSELTKKEMFGNSLEERMIEKRRLLNNHGDDNSPLHTERVSENEFSERKINSFSESDNEKETTNYQQRSDWEYRQKFSFPNKPGNFRNPAEFYPKQFFTDQMNSNLKYNRDRGDAFEKSPSRWNEERNFQQSSNSENSRLDYNFNGRAPAEINDRKINEYLEKSGGDSFDRRVSITTLNDMGMRNEKNYNYENVGEIYPPNFGHHSMSYYNKHPYGFWHPNFQKPEKELIINFNTECPTSRQFNNKLVHKFIFAPKSPIDSQPSQHEIPNIQQIPETAIISGHKVIPIYYV